MHLHEYQVKELLTRGELPVPLFFTAQNEEALNEGLKQLPGEEFVLKIQVHAGGRGKAGGVKFAKSVEEAKTVGASLINFKLVNEQTGPTGKVSERLLVTIPVKIKREFYLAILVDRKKRGLSLLLSSEGGMEIEEVAKKSPEKILMLSLLSDGRLFPFHVARIARFLDWNESLTNKGVAIIMRLIQLFLATDASLLEINPLVETDEGELVILDAKMTIDDNALFRQTWARDIEDLSQLSTSEQLAKSADLAYVGLDGSIGCMVNGAGLAMATMDMIQIKGGMPANFLDVGGSATEEKITEGFNILLSDSNVKAILINIFGGIMNCATIAQGVVAAAKKRSLHVPLVVRLEGTNVEEGRKIFEESSLELVLADSLEDAAEKAVKSVGA